MLQFKWIKLNAKSIPLIQREMMGVIAQYNHLRKQIDQGGIEDLQQLVDLKAQVEKRVEELDNFFQENEDVEGISYLNSYKQFMHKKICSQNYKSNISEENKQVPWKIKRKVKKDQDLSMKASKKSVSPLKQSKSGFMKNSNYLNQSSKMANKSPSSFTMTKGSVNSSRSLLKNSKQVQTKSTNQAKSFVDDKIEKLKATFNEKKQSLTAQEAIQGENHLQISFNNKEIFSDAKQETLFTIKMTKKQYNQLLKMKPKGKISN